MKKVDFNENCISSKEFIALMEAKRYKKKLSKKIIIVSLILGISLNNVNVYGENLKSGDLNNTTNNEVNISNVLNEDVNCLNNNETSKAVEEKTEVLEPNTCYNQIYNPKINMPKSHQEYLYKLCQERGLDYRKMLSIIKNESQFDPNCISDRDYGYFQINKVNHSELAKELNTANDPLDPYVNLNWGTYMLSNIYSYWSKNGHTGKDLDRLAWSEFNEGHAGLQKWGLANTYIQRIENERNFIDSVFS